MHRSFRALVAALVLAGALSACAPAAPGGGADPEAEEQTRREACDQMLPVLFSQNERMTGAFEELATDPSGASPLLRSVGEEFRSAIEELENDEVIDVMTTAVDSLDAMTDEVDKSLAGEQNVAALQAAIAQVQTDFTAIDSVCKPA